MSNSSYDCDVPVFLPELARVPRLGVLELLGEGEALPIPPSMVRLILNKPVGTNDNLLA